jgi:3-hydroxyisobutyrate dehydrogenase-like beta-hydroxyacid dehydrogenase
MSETIGFIGLGQLGLPMATNLLNAGYALRVYNRTASKAEPLLAQGAHLATRPAEVATPGGIVMTIVWDDAALESIVTSDGFLERLGPGGVHVAMSTVSPETSKKLAAIHAQHGCDYIDAPIFGGSATVAAHQLWIPFSGPQSAKERVRPLLSALGGQAIVDFGEEVGTATLVKLVGNFLIVAAGCSMREAISVAEKHGVDLVAVVNMLTQAPMLFPSPVYQRYGKRLAEGTAVFGQSKVPMKDVDIFKKTAQQIELSTPITDLLSELMRSNEARA